MNVVSRKRRVSIDAIASRCEVVKNPLYLLVLSFHFCAGVQGALLELSFFSVCGNCLGWKGDEHMIRRIRDGSSLPDSCNSEYL